jgi:cytochrome P450
LFFAWQREVLISSALEEALQAALAAGGIRHDAAAQAWRVTAFRIGRTILADPDFRKPDFAPLPIEQLPRAIGLLVRRGEALQHLWTAPPPHAGWPVRRTFVAAFAPRRLDYLRNDMRVEAKRLLAGPERGSFDLDRDFAQPFTQWAVARVYGVDPADIARVARLTEPLGAAFSFDDRDRASAAIAMAAIEPVLMALLRGTPRAGAAALETVRAELAAEAITTDEALSWMALTLLAGLQTNRRFLVRWLTEAGPATAEYADDYEGAGLAVVAELTRLYVDVVSPARQSRRAFVLRDVVIPSGSTFLLDLALINHDPTRFSEPKQFCPARQDSGHLSFGYGAHMCVGRHLAMMQIDCVARVLAENGPELRASLARSGNRMAPGGLH